jgi:MazG family protein
MKQHYAGSFERLLTIMKELRENCPWDKKQTIHTLRPLTIEETYELVDAITDENWSSLKEELGDLLLHIVFYARIAEEKNEFTIDDVIATVCNKLIHRHPHIYDHTRVANDDEVKQNWEKLKLNEGKKSVLGGVPNALPAMIKALRLQEKAKYVGFEWENKSQVYEKVKEELEELQEEITLEDKTKIEEEFGDVLFALINYARFIDVDPEHALEKTNKKFIRRFMLMEQYLTDQGKLLQEYSLEEMDAIWNQIKQGE